MIRINALHNILFWLCFNTDRTGEGPVASREEEEGGLRCGKAALKGGGGRAGWGLQELPRVAAGGAAGHILRSISIIVALSS
jgi:hypothetical protein